MITTERVGEGSADTARSRTTIQRGNLALQQVRSTTPEAPLQLPDSSQHERTVATSGRLRTLPCEHEDPNLFFPPTEHPNSVYAQAQIEQAKRVCRPCPVRTACRDWAIAWGEDGVWGATSRSEREAMGQRKTLPNVWEVSA